MDMVDETRPPRTGAERQAAYAARRRRLTPLERDLRVSGDQIYTQKERAILARIVRARDALIDDCARLNIELRARLLAASMDPELGAEERERIRLALALLERRSLLSLPEF